MSIWPAYSDTYFRLHALHTYLSLVEIVAHRIKMCILFSTESTLKLESNFSTLSIESFKYFKKTVRLFQFRILSSISKLLNKQNTFIACFIFINPIGLIKMFSEYKAQIFSIIKPESNMQISSSHDCILDLKREKWAIIYILSSFPYQKITRCQRVNRTFKVPHSKDFLSLHNTCDNPPTEFLLSY